MLKKKKSSSIFKTFMCAQFILLEEYALPVSSPMYIDAYINSIRLYIKTIHILLKAFLLYSQNVSERGSHVSQNWRNYNHTLGDCHSC